MDNTDFKFNENTLIISCIDYEYCEIDMSYEVNNDYLLYKQLKNLETKIDNTKKDLEMKIENTKKDLEMKMKKGFDDVDSRFDDVNSRFDSLIEILQKNNPGIKYHQEIHINKTKEEKKDYH